MRKNKVKKDIKVLTIYRNLWGKHALLQSRGNRMCCLGHLGVACGIPKEELRGRTMPSSLSNYLRKKYPKKFTRVFFESASHINDGEGITKEKEEELKALFKKYGVTIRFTGLRCQARVSMKLPY